MYRDGHNELARMTPRTVLRDVFAKGDQDVGRSLCSAARLVRSRRHEATTAWRWCRATWNGLFASTRR